MTDLGVTIANSLDQARNSVSTTHGDIDSILGAQLANRRQRCLRSRLYLTSDPGGDQVKLNEYACLLGSMMTILCSQGHLAGRHDGSHLHNAPGKTRCHAADRASGSLPHHRLTRPHCLRGTLHTIALCPDNAAVPAKP